MEHLIANPSYIIGAMGIILFLMVCSAFFSAAETAMTGASEAIIHRASISGDKRAKIVVAMQKDKTRMIAGLLIGNNLFNIFSSTLATAVLITLYGDKGIIIATFTMTVLLLVFSEIIPKAYALRNSETMALRIARTLKLVLFVLAPVTRLLELLVIKLFRSKTKDNIQPEESEIELRGIIDLHHDGSLASRHEREMLHSILDLDDMIVEKIMTHRGEVRMVSTSTTWGNLLNIASKSHFSRLPVYSGSSENIIGILLVRRLLLYANKNKEGSITMKMWKKLMQPIWFIPNYTSLLEQLHAFRRRHEHFAVVVDEYGILQGIVTLEDVLEEIVGEIEDENEVARESLLLAKDGSITVAGAMSLRELNRRFQWNLPDDDVSTVAGLIMFQSKIVPNVNQKFVFFGFRFIILKMVRQRITQLKIIPEVHKNIESYIN